jgi:TonB family protein
MLEATAAPGSDATAAWEAFGRELAARARGDVKAGDRTDLVTSEGGRHLDFLRVLAALPAASKAERAAAMRTLGSEAPAPHPMRQSPPSRQPPESVPMRLASAPWPGFIRELFATSGCASTSSPQFIAAQVSYRANGAPIRVGIDPNGPPSCVTALGVLARISVAQRDHPVTKSDDGSEWVILPLEVGSSECMDTPTDAPMQVGSQAEGGSKVTTPKKIRDVRPVYPRIAQASGMQGTVVMEATITATGCVAAVHTTEGLTPSLDFAALQAVTGWRFTPTLLDGSPVPVKMTVTVNFTLR